MESACKSEQLFLFAGPNKQVMASPSITTIINEYDLSLWEKLNEEDFEVQESAMKLIFELLQERSFECTLSKVGKKLYLTSFKK